MSLESLTVNCVKYKDSPNEPAMVYHKSCRYDINANTQLGNIKRQIEWTPHVDLSAWSRTWAWADIEMSGRSPDDRTNSLTDRITQTGIEDGSK